MPNLLKKNCIICWHNNEELNPPLIKQKESPVVIECNCITTSETRKRIFSFSIFRIKLYTRKNEKNFSLDPIYAANGFVSFNIRIQLISGK